MVQNRNTFDFRVAIVNGSRQLSGLFFVYGEDSKGFGFILDNSYSMTTKVYPPPASTQFNMHEFKVLGNGCRALHFMVRPKFADVTALDIEVEEGWIADVGFREVDISSRATLFEWWALDHISPAESTVGATDLAGPTPTSWNWLLVTSFATGHLHFANLCALVMVIQLTRTRMVITLFLPGSRTASTKSLRMGLLLGVSEEPIHLLFSRTSISLDSTTLNGWSITTRGRLSYFSTTQQTFTLKLQIILQSL